jgi:zinc protease
MLGTLLSGGQSSRLYRNLVDTQMALSVRAGYSDSLLPGLFEISAQPRAGIAPEKVEAAIYAELEKLQTTPVDEHELQKAKNQQIAAYYRGIQSIERRASAIGYAQEFYGDWHEVNKTVDRINAITAADIQRVAKQYLVANQRTVATLIPDATSAAGNTEKRDGR